MSESGRTEWEWEIDWVLAEVAALRRRLDDLELERVVARLARRAQEAWRETA